MPDHKKWIKAVVIALMIGVIFWLNYFSSYHMRYQHALYRMLFYLPLVLGSFWFGLKGAIYVCASITIFFLPYVIIQWQGFSLEDFHELLEGVLYIIIAFVLGFLIEKERKEHIALVRAESLAEVGKAVSEVAHDMKTPLMAIGGFANQVSRKLRHEDPNRKKLSVFHPFFSTKKRGTGLGLGIVKNIVEAHGGEVSFHPNPEKGVTFSVLLPF